MVETAGARFEGANTVTAIVPSDGMIGDKLARPIPDHRLMLRAYKFQL